MFPECHYIASKKDSAKVVAKLIAAHYCLRVPGEDALGLVF